MSVCVFISFRRGVERSATVKRAMMYAWSQYKSHAWGADEILPKTGGRKDAWGGMRTPVPRNISHHVPVCRLELSCP